MEKDPDIYQRRRLDAIDNIEADTAGYDFERFRPDRRVRQLVERNVEILSEASRRLPRSMTAQEAGIPWRAVVGIGNILRHDYHRTYPTVLWETCQKDLPTLKEAVLRMVARIGRSPPGSDAHAPV